MCNVGGIDRFVRIIAGAAIIIAGIIYQSWLGAIGVIPLATGLFRFCPLYKVIGVSTCEIHSNKKQAG